uniref:Actin-binding transcription modulator n=1 Tax=Parastrongyloides trichosuri TaxID=131310 RepID=A0A0N4ZKA6_PARTI
MNGDRRNKWNEEHENVNQSCLYNEDKECIIKDIVSLSHDEELVETNYYKNEINLVSNNENLELTSNVSFLYETRCPHTGIKKLVVGGNQCATSDDKYILIFGIKNSNKFILLKRIFHFLYKLSNINDIYHFNKELYKTNESKEMCIYEFNNSKIPYKICVIDCPEYDVSHDQMKKKFTMKRLYKEFLRKYVFSKGYLLLSSVIITVNEKLNLKFLKEIKKLKIFFKECDNPNVFEKCFNGKFINNENDVIYMNDMDEYFKKIENNYQILLKTSLI